MKYLIVNADDFGGHPGINRGILEAHRCGILTSTSLLVNRPGSEEAAELSRAAPELSVGLHFELAEANGECLAELSCQFARFEELVGRAPTHLDAHHNMHRDPVWLPHFLEMARRHRLPLREHSPVRYFSKFYGRWNDETHLEQVSVESLSRMLETEVEDGITELSCHPGYVDADYAGSYSVEREAELHTLCDRRIRAVLMEQSIQLISYHDLSNLVVSAST